MTSSRTLARQKWGVAKMRVAYAGVVTVQPVRTHG
jgi:hypothetical protein